MAQILKAAPAVKAITEKLIPRVEALASRGVTPTLAIVRVGARPDDLSYERGAMKRCAACGIEAKNVVFPEDVSQSELMAAIEDINGDDTIHGVLMFRPLPKSLDEAAICAALDPRKDMDGITAGSLAAVFSGAGEGYPPCTAQACIELLDHYGIEIEGKRATVMGRSNVIGKPVAMLLLRRNATVTICHTRTRDPEAVCGGAEILIAAAGCPGLISPAHTSKEQVILDVGINVLENGSLVGDVAFDAVEPIVSAITPVPGGVGSVTTAVLAMHVVTAAEKTL